MRILRWVAVLFLIFLWGDVVNAQGNLGTCTVVDWHDGKPVTAPAPGQDLRVTCPRLFDGLSELQVFTKLLAVFEKSGYQNRPFQLNKLQDQFGVRTPLEAVGATQLIVYKLGYGSYVVNFVPSVIAAKPVILGVKSVELDRIEQSRTPPAPGVIPRLRFRYHIIFDMDNVGGGGTGLFHYVRRNGEEYLHLGQISPRSSGLASPQGSSEIYDDELDDIVGVYVTDPNDPTAPASDVFPLTAPAPGAE
jgi:hypothetical protein